jgi:biopolymer transport protein ExbD
MRFRQHQTNSLPDVDMIPMLNVMMGILAFFVMITMNLANHVLVDVRLPGKTDSKQPQPLANRDQLFVVELDAQGQASFKNQPLAPDQLTQQIQGYLQQNATGTVFLKPDPTLSYDRVMTQLIQMRSAGGERVSLVIE